MTPFLYAVVVSCFSGVLAHWRSETMRFWDSAVKGSSSLRAALLRNLTSEIAASDGNFMVTALSDFEAFYDYLEWDVVLDVAEAEDFPLRLLGLLFLMHSAPRLFLVGDAASRWVQPTPASTWPSCSSTQSWTKPTAATARRSLVSTSTTRPWASWPSPGRWR